MKTNPAIPVIHFYHYVPQLNKGFEAYISMHGYARQEKTYSVSICYNKPKIWKLGLERKPYQPCCGLPFIPDEVEKKITLEDFNSKRSISKEKTTEKHHLIFQSGFKSRDAAQVFLDNCLEDLKKQKESDYVYNYFEFAY